MRPAIVACLVLAACGRGRAPGHPVIPIDPNIELPKVAGARPLNQRDRVTLELTASGAVRAEGEGVSLSELGEWLEERRRRCGTHYRRTPSRDLIDAGPVSDLYVLFRVDRRAAWEHVSYVLRVLLEQRICCLQFAVEGGRIDAFLPADFHMKRTELPIEIYIKARVLAHSGGVAYGFGDRATTDVGVVRAWVSEAFQMALDYEDVGVVGEVRADSMAEFGAVVGVLADMRLVGLQWLKFAGADPAPEDHGRMRSLPYPKRNTLIRGVSPWPER